jgi:hypothetical protein
MLKWLRSRQLSKVTRERVTSMLQECGGRVHVGCNDVKVAGYVNVDVRATRATDVVHDCKDLAIFLDKSVSVLFSNAFFEHLYVTERLPFLQDAARTLAEDGLLLFTGLPDFEEVARAYIERREPGHISTRFDLFEVYRYTHGAPEGRPSWWLAQLHKGLLDTDTVIQLLRQSGYASALVFRYCWGNEPHPVTLGFAARKTRSDITLSDPAFAELLKGLPANINWSSVSEVVRL